MHILSIDGNKSPLKVPLCILAAVYYKQAFMSS